MSRLFWVGVLLTSTAGCRSLSPDRDLGHAEQLISERTRIAVDWQSPVLDFAEPLTIDAATRLALSRHPRIGAEIASVAEARADLVQAGLLPNPVLQGALGIPIDGGGGSPAMASLVQPLAALWQRPARIDSAERRLRQRVLQLSDAALRLAADVRSRYAEVVYGGDIVALDRRLAEIRQQQLSLLRQAYDQGEASRTEVNNARQSCARANDQLLRGTESWQQASHRLEERTGIPVVEAQEYTLPTLRAVPTEQRTLELAARQRLDVAAAFAAFDASTAVSRLARWQRLPELAVGADFQQNFSNREGIFPRASITLPIFDTGAAALAKAEAIERRTLHEADLLLRDALLEARQAHTSWRLSEERLRRLESDWLPAATENAALARKAFEAGEESLLTVLDHEASFVIVSRERAQLALDVYRAYFTLERSAGGRLQP